MDATTRTKASELVALVMALVFLLSPAGPVEAQPTPARLYYVVLDSAWYEAPAVDGVWARYLVPSALMMGGSTQVSCRRTNGQALIPSDFMLIYGQQFGFLYLQLPIHYDWHTIGAQEVLVLRMTSSTGDVICDNALTEEPIPSNRADLSVTLTDSTDPVTPSTPYSYTASVHNAGPDPAASPKILFVMPSEATYVGASGAGWACTRAGVQVTCTRASLAVGATAVATLDLISPGTSGVTVEASATVSSNTIDQNTSNNTSIQTTTVTGQASTADLAITMVDDYDPVVVSTQFAYQVQVKNNGPSNAANVKIEYNLPGPLSYHSASGSGWTCNEVSRKITCTRTTLASNAMSTVAVAVSAPGTSTTVTNTVKVSSNTPDQITGNNTAVETTAVVDQSQAADLAVSIANVGQQEVNAEYAYTLGVTNYGPKTASGVETTITLPTGLTYKGSSGTGWSCLPPLGSATVVCSRTDTLLSGMSSPLVIQVKAPSGATAVTVTAKVKSALADGNLSNNQASVTHQIVTGSGGGPNWIFGNGFEFAFFDGFEHQ